MAEPTHESSSASWDNYWRGALNAAAFSSGGVSHPALDGFWQQFFAGTGTTAATAIDIASGNGAVIEAATRFFGASCPHFTCLDISQAALDAIRQRFPQVSGIVADARSTNLPTAGFDMATSQYGVEYAGEEAVFEAARLVANSGWLGLVLHCRQGGIFTECSTSLEAIERLQTSEFLPRAIAMFRAGFAACQGADRAPYDAAAMAFAPTVAQLESIMTDHGVNVAGGTLSQLHENVERFHQRMPHYKPEEVMSWLERMNSELDAYAMRMQSMRDAALDGPTFERIGKELARRGFAIKTARALSAAKDQPPLAWALVAQNQA